MKPLTRLASGALALATSLAALTVVAPSAQAAYSPAVGGTGSLPKSCKGSYVGGTDPRSSAAQKFRVDVFYSSANGGTNCVIFYNNTGVRSAMRLKVETADFRSYATDVGNYISYAGPVAVSGTAKKCINVWADVTYRGQTLNYDLSNHFCR